MMNATACACPKYHPAAGRARSGGFSLIELSVVLVIIGLLVGGGIAALDATRTQIKRSDQAQQLERVRDALHGFAMRHGRLPCPDNPGTGNSPGQEDATGGPCDANTGMLPWRDLGVGRRDAWGHPLIYHVDRDFADAPFLIDTDPDLVTVVDENGQEIAKTPAVVVSVGGQGDQFWGDDCPGSSGDDTITDGFSDHETDNCDVNDNDRFVDAGFRTSDADDGRFDDMLFWISAPVLKAKLVEAGKLP